MKKRIFSLLLAALLVSSAALVSCSNDTDDKGGNDTTAGDTTTAAPTTTEPEETVDPAFLDELPDKEDFNGYEFRVLTKLHPDGEIAWKRIDISAESENGERINDAVFARNMQMNERFNVTVVEDNLDNNPYERARTLIQSGDEAFTVMSMQSQWMGSLAIQGLSANMAKMNYINFDKAWWDGEAAYQMAIDKDHIYLAGGSATLNTFRATWGVLFNKDLVADANIPDLYQTVRDGDWTLDLLKEYSKKIARDVNGNGELDYGTDVYGLAYQYECILPLYQGTGAKVVEMKDNGKFEIGIDSARAMEAMEKVYNFMNVDAEAQSLTDDRTAISSMGIWQDSRNFFMQGLFGFYMGHLSTPVLVTDSESDFGILPMPKVDDAQEKYASSYQYNNYDAIGVPKNAADLDRTGMLLEGFEMLSYDTVREAWYDYTLTLRAARDKESGEMLDIIFGSRGCDIAFVYNSSTGAQSLLGSAMKTTSFTWASTAAAEKATLQTKMQEVVDALLSFDE